MRNEQDLTVVTEAAWTSFRGRLADHIAAMKDDDVLVVHYDDGVYVQLCAFGEDLVRVEAVSSGFLPEGHELTFDQEIALMDLGWSGPDDEAGLENFNDTFELREADEVAVLLVQTLREVYGVPHPSFLAASGLEADPDAPVMGPEVPVDEPYEGPDPTRFPTGHEELQELVDRAMGEVFPELAHDDDGDIPIVAGQSVAFLRVRNDRPAVDIFAEVVVGPEDLEALSRELELLNAAHGLWKFQLRGERVVMNHEFLAIPFSGFRLRMVVKQFADEVDQIATELVARVGGRRFAQPEPEEDPRDLLMTGLLELLHLERVRSSAVAAFFDHDRLEIIRQIVRIRGGQQFCGDIHEEVVLTALRKALRHVAGTVKEPEFLTIPPRPRRPPQPGLESLDVDEDFGLDWSA